VTLDGTVDELLADMTGASELNAKGLRTKTAEISTTGAADAEISVSETLKVTITGAGNVSYYGTPGLSKNTSPAPAASSTKTKTDVVHAFASVAHEGPFVTAASLCEILHRLRGSG
jgi:hypothetical protein